MNIDSTVVFRYISPLYDHPIVCDWAKIGRTRKKAENLPYFAALIAANWPVRQRQNAANFRPVLNTIFAQSRTMGWS